MTANDADEPNFGYATGAQSLRQRRAT